MHVVTHGSDLEMSQSREACGVEMRGNVCPQQIWTLGRTSELYKYWEIPLPKEKKIVLYNFRYVNIGNMPGDVTGLALNL